MMVSSRPAEKPSWTPTSEQQAILDNDRGARVRVVAAAPGSGKTFLASQLIRRELESWEGPGGIAGLSFTRVARDAIADALGGVLPDHPHFVGTLDSFVYRYVFRVFGVAIFPWLRGVRLIPALRASQMGSDWGPHALTVPIGGTRIPIFDVHIRRREAGGSRIFYKTDRMTGIAEVSTSDRRAVVDKKMWLWRTMHVASHSDVAYLSWRIITHRTHGPACRALLAKRFPLIVLDEVQDTGWFLGATIRAMLAETSTRGVVVGDADQAIYEFGGALPEDIARFEQLDGAVSYPMRQSFRCPAKVCRVATSLSWQARTVQPRRKEAGLTILYVYDSEPDVDGLCDLIEEDVGFGPTTVLVRGRAGMATLIGKRPTLPRLGSRPLQHLWSACEDFRRGRAREALSRTEAAVGRALFATEVPTPDEIAEAGLDATAWRALLASTLEAVAQVECKGSLHDWGCAAREVVLDTLGDLSSLDGVTGRLRRPNATNKNRKAARYMTAPAPSRISRRCDTVHGAKGETHEISLLFVPESKADRCPGTTWFSEDPDHAEERRIAFVAASRPRRAFVLCVHSTTFERLAASAPDFLALFDVRRLDGVVQ